MSKIIISGWFPGCKTIHGIKTLQLYAKLSMTEAKAVIDSVLSGNIETVTVDDAKNVEKTTKELASCGFLTKEMDS